MSPAPLREATIGKTVRLPIAAQGASSVGDVDGVLVLRPGAVWAWLMFDVGKCQNSGQGQMTEGIDPH